MSKLKYAVFFDLLRLKGQKTQLGYAAVFPSPNSVGYARGLGWSHSDFNGNENRNAPCADFFELFRWER